MISDEWKDQGLCRQIGGDMWFPEHMGSNEANEAKAICRSCPVQELCLWWAFAYDENFGIWGASSDRDRRAMRRDGRARRILAAGPDLNLDFTEHGTSAGYKRHYRRGEKPCESCRVADVRDRANRAARRATRLGA